MMDISELLKKAAESVPALASLKDKQIRMMLDTLADTIIDRTDYILSENQKDLDRMDPADPKYDRLQLTAGRIRGMADDIKHVATLPSPVGEIRSETIRPNGMKIQKVAVPFGVIGVIYEARPNVTLDVFSLCIRTKNVCVLKGGSDAYYTNEALVAIIHATLSKHEIPAAICTLLPPDREATLQLLNATAWVNVLIPRGSSALIRFVRENARIPVIETGAGVCHTYLETSGDKVMARAIVTNAKTRRVSVCNALDCFLIDAARLEDLAFICQDLAAQNVLIFADEAAYRALEESYPPALLQQASDDSYGTEFLDYKMSIRTVDGLSGALEHIRQYSSKHSECIITENQTLMHIFEEQVDAACVYCNVSTAFTDGGQFGLGAEIGISTQKLHARGPMGLDALTSYKYLIRGNGQTRK